MYELNESKKHIGFSGEAAAEVRWSDESYLMPVAAYERKHLRPYNLLFGLGWLLLLLIAISLHFIQTKYDDRIASEYVLTLQYLTYSIGGLGFVILFLNGHIIKLILLRMIRSRHDALFAANWSCIYVEVESAATFDKMKLSAEDFGLLQIQEGYAYLEMMNHRARFSLADVSFAYFEAGTQAVGIKMSCDVEPWLWSVSLVAPPQSPNLLLGASHKWKANWLKKKIDDKINENVELLE